MDTVIDIFLNLVIEIGYNIFGKRKKILYVTDLDGTLLNSKDSLSEYTIKTINNLINQGLCFSYATARSLSSAKVVTNGLILNNPVIVYNGTFIKNPNTGEILFSIYFNEQEKETVKNYLIDKGVYPLVYGNVNGEEKVSWVISKENNGIKHYLNSRKGDKRLRPIETLSQLYEGDLFYFTCIENKKEDLTEIYEYFSNKNEYNCTIQKELYREEYWCEIMPKKATKGNAILTLKEILKCDKIISFGDSINDIPMFKISDESYAVENAVDELKKYANEIIMSNDNDGVAHWLENNINKNMEYNIMEINDNLKKSEYTDTILRKLPEWFGNEKSLIEYVNSVLEYPFWVALDNDKCIGILSGKIHYSRTGEIYVCGIDPNYHRKGIGTLLYKEFEKYCIKNNCEYIIVKTLSELANYEYYLNTKKFYDKIGFKELITLTEMWDKDNPCLIMIKNLK